jgi:hypothetical protein
LQANDMHTKVFWTDDEKRQLCCAALDIQKERPDLAGLALLRQAIRTLPEDRWRKLTTLAREKWFEAGMEIEAKLRAAQADSAVTTEIEVLKEGVETYRTLNDEVASFNERYLKLNDEQLATLRQKLSVARAQADLEGKWMSKHIKLMEENQQHQYEIIDVLNAMRNDGLLMCTLLKDMIKEIAEVKAVLVALPVFKAAVKSKLRWYASRPPQDHDSSPMNGHSNASGAARLPREIFPPDA